MNVRVTTSWIWHEAYDYPVDGDLPDGWDEWDMSEKAEWVYLNCDGIQVYSDPIEEVELLDVEVWS